MTELGVQKKLGKSGVYVQVLEMSFASLGRWEQKNQYCMKIYSSRINYITLLTNNNFNMVLVPSSVRITEPESNRYRNILDTLHILSHSKPRLERHVFVIEFLHRVVDTIEDYFSECSEIE